MTLIYLIKNHIPLLVIIMLFSLMTLYQSITLPLGEAADETDHYQYHQFVAAQGHPPLTEADRQTAGFKGGLAPLYYTLTAWPITLVGGPEAPPTIRRTDQRPERHIPNDGLGFNRVLHTFDEAWPWQGQVLAWHLVRLLSLPMAWVTIIATYLLAHLLIKSNQSALVVVPLIAAGFVAFLPRFIISSAVINDDNLVFALSSLILLLEIRLIQGDLRYRMVGLLGFLFGLALLTKYFSLILFPEVILTFWLVWRYQKQNGLSFKAYRVSLFIFLSSLLITAGPWFGFIIYRFNRVAELGWIAGLAASLGEPQITEGLIGLLSGQSIRPSVITYPFSEWFGLLYRSFWFEYGWMNIFAPTWVYGIFTILIAVPVIGLLWTIKSANSTNHQSVDYNVSSAKCFQTKAILMVRLGLFMVVVLSRYVLSATIDTGQGRHLYPALAVIAIAVGVGIWHLGQNKLQTRWRITYYGTLSGAYIAVSWGVLLWPHSILSHYPVIPTVNTIVAQPKPQTEYHVEFAEGLALLGFDAPAETTRGTILPITVYWQAKQEADQDYLVGLCVTKMGCWYGYPVNGQYPPRAWEVGDTIIDTIHLPLRSNKMVTPTLQTVNLKVWSLKQDTVVPITQTELLAIELTQIKIKPSTKAILTTEWYYQSKQVEDSVELSLHENLIQLDSDTNQSQLWPPFITYQDQSLTHQHYIVHAGLTPHHYSSDSLAVRLNLRQRAFKPLSQSLNFGGQVAPLLITINNNNVTPTTQLYPYHLTEAIPAFDTIPITIHWQAQQWMAEPLIIALKMVDKDFVVGAEQVVRLGDRYPNLLWAPGEVVEETYSLPLPSNTPPGLYQLELSVIQQNEQLPNGFASLPLHNNETQSESNLYPFTLRVLDSGHDISPSNRVNVQVDHNFTLHGYDLNQIGAEVNLALYWRNQDKPATDYTVFTQLLGPDWQVWAQWDNPPQAGRYPTSQWQAQDRVIDRYTLTIPDDAPHGNYKLLIGMYDPQTGTRLPITRHGQPQPDNAIWLDGVIWSP